MTLIKNISLIPLFLLGAFLLDPFSTSIYIGYLVILYMFFFKNKQFLEIVDSESLILLCFSLIYSAFDFLNGNDRGIQLLIVQSLFPFFFYCSGKILITKKLNQKNVFFLFLFFPIIYSLSSIATVLLDINEGGFSQINRDFKNVWDGRIILATGMAGYLIYNVSLPIFIFSKSTFLSLIERLILLAVFLTSLVCSFRLGSRTIIVLSVCSLLLGIFYQLRTLKPKEKLRFILSIFATVIILVQVAPIDLEADYFSTLGHRLREGTSSNASAGGRTELWINGFSKMFTNPLGWNSEKYGHNMWLDTAKVSGLIALVFLILFTIKTIVNTKKAFLIKNLDSSLKLCFGLFTMVSLIFFFGEPILEGNIFLFVFFCLQQGILKKSLELFQIQT